MSIQTLRMLLVVTIAAILGARALSRTPVAEVVLEHYTVTDGPAGSSTLQLTLGEDDARRLAEAMHAHQGERLRLVARGVVVQEATVRSELEGRGVQLSFDDPMDLARARAALTGS